jgi:formate hydrogenlyase subunit 3/multisubunit Na+/H+ antiporter MnhD subunit
MFLYALCTSLFFALLSDKTEKRERVQLFAWIFVALFIGGIAIGWAMFPFPK